MDDAIVNVAEWISLLGSGDTPAIDIGAVGEIKPPGHPRELHMLLEAVEMTGRPSESLPIV
jgi:hypothetical protein